MPKFIRFKQVLVDGLTHHSRQVFPTLEVKPGDKVVDFGCGFGDTAIELAKIVGPTGSVLGLDCCDAFLQSEPDDARARGIENVRFVEADVQSYAFAPEHNFCFSRFGTQFFENPRRRAEDHAPKPEARRHHDDDRLAYDRRQSVARAAETDRGRLSAATGRACSDMRAGAVFDGRPGAGQAATQGRGL